MPVIELPCAADLLALHAADAAAFPFLLETRGDTGWDILFAHPLSQRSCFPGDCAFLPLLDQAWQGIGHEPDADAMAAGLPFRGGWFVYLGYELLHEIEPTVSRQAMDSRFPLGWLARVPAAILVDRARQRTCLFAEAGHENILNDLRRALDRHAPFKSRSCRVTHLVEEAPQGFLDGVERIKRYIREGDVFQVNLARRWGADWAGDSASLYGLLRQRNPAPFGGIAKLGDAAIVSSSPERLVRVEQGRIETRPIAGTHPRSADPVEDEALKQRLIAHPKERAEHIMLVDLERNDLGRLCMPGSVRVNELATVRSYATVHHIESNVVGRLRDGVGPGAIVRALFPGGTITGCPKVRCMQVIAELEPSPRLAYTGSMGYVNLDGGMDLNILIRSFMTEQGRLGFKAGAGIVADSVLERELNETRAKALGLLRALEGAGS